MENEYTGLSQDQLFGHLAEVEAEINDIHSRRTVLSVEEINAQKHREAIQRALGVIVLGDHRQGELF